MAVFSPARFLALGALLAPLACANAAPATIGRDRQAPILLDAQSTSIDLKTNSAVFTKIRISQGAMSITADQGQASQQRSADMYFENNVWNFRGNVKITVEQGQLFSDDAQITFINNELSKAVVNGKPASFEQTIDQDREAGQRPRQHHRLRCDKASGAVLEGCVFDQRGPRNTGQALKYDIVGQKVVCRGSRTEFAARAHRHHAAAAENGPAQNAAAQIQSMSVLRALESRQELQITAGVRDLSLEVESGEVVGLLGPNGAGKTTAFYMIVGLTRCEHGEIFLDNKDISRLPMHRRAQLGLGYLPQEPSVFRKLSVSDNIMAILETRPGLDDAGRTARLKELLGELHIGHVRDSLGMSLSGGERRRVEIARALGGRSAIYVAG